MSDLSLNQIIGLILLAAGILAALNTGIGIYRAHRVSVRIHITSMTVFAALIPAFLGSAIYIGGTQVLTRVLVAFLFLGMGAPYLSQVLLARAVHEGETEPLPALPLPERNEHAGEADGGDA